MSNFAEINYEKNMRMLEEAYEYSNRTYTHDEIINVLKGDNHTEKQYCLIELDSVLSQNEADILVSNLTNQPGPVRETASYKIYDLAAKKAYQPFFQTTDILNTFIDAVTDINPSVSRNATCIIKYAENRDYLFNNFVSKINVNLKELENLDKNNSYSANKIKFALYWNLEALSNIVTDGDFNDELLKIIHDASLIQDYTIREKTAKLISTIKPCDEKAFETIDLLRNDANIYVRKYFSRTIMI